jgi:murein DD-endopeptidase MepM/ murein hydrolase activator NlpD
VNARAAYQMSKGGTDFGAWGIGPNAYRKMPALDFTGYPGPSPQARAMSSQAAQNITINSTAPVDPKAVGNFTGATAQLAENQDAISKVARLNTLLAQAAPSEATQSILGRLGGIAGRTAQHIAHAPVELRLPDPIYKQFTPQTGTPVEAAPATRSDYRGKVLVPTIGPGTHVTDNLDWNHGDKTARDIMAKPGTPVGAPESGQVVRWGGAQGGEAMYFKGDSGRMYWLGHIDDRLPVGTHVEMGQPMAVISKHHKAPHLHFDYKE